MTKKEVKQLQRDMNDFTTKRLKNFPFIIVDGDRGFATNRRIVMCKFFLGYTGKSKRSHRLTPPFREQLEHPNLIEPEEMRKLGVERRAAQHKRARERVPAGVTTFDAQPVAKWMVPYLALDVRTAGPARSSRAFGLRKNRSRPASRFAMPRPVRGSVRHELEPRWKDETERRLGRIGLRAVWHADEAGST